jgi:hypothetical protein
MMFGAPRKWQVHILVRVRVNHDVVISVLNPHWVQGSGSKTLRNDLRFTALVVHSSALFSRRFHVV